MNPGEEVRLPTIGQIVVFVQPEHEQPFNGHREHPAVVTAVWAADCVNLKVLFDCGPVEDRTSQLRGESWVWPVDA